MPQEDRITALSTVSPAGRHPDNGPPAGCVVAALSVAVLAYGLLQTLVAPALPTFKRHFQVSGDWAAWIFTLYLLSGAVLTPVLARLGDRRGKRRVLLASLAVFGAGTVLAALAWSFPVLLLARAAQGAGAAALPLSFGLVSALLPPRRIGHGLGIVSSMIGAGTGLGFVVGGLLVDHASWRWMFAVLAGVIAVAFLLVARWIPSDTGRRYEPQDALGTILLSLGLVALLIAITQGSQAGWLSAPVLGLFITAAAFLTALAVAEKRTPHPLLEPRVFLDRPMLLTHCAAALFYAAALIFFLLVPTLAQLPTNGPEGAAQGFGFTVTGAGLLMLPSALLQVLVAPLVPALERTLGHRAPLLGGLSLVLAGSLALALWHATPVQVLADSLLLGTGAALSFAALPSLVVRFAPGHAVATANGLNTVVRTVGGVIGTQVAIAILSAHSVTGSALPGGRAFTVVFVLGSLFAAVGVVVVLLLPRAAARR
ncbi:MFS transporter [Streptomyces peucetius]|uniref:MFS transporter n=1 Tax=Streptomyces peucetius TaxID=1950 RepID=A0ABY6I7L3_STRPE|nr:MFS transporter [Streptomyces peucetius]UYQ61972.1 MFS transporter [Streptomyces peucetius]